MYKLLLTLILLASTGCAMSRSHFASADGDVANKMAISTIGKQEVEQKTSFQVYPNNSGMDLQDGAVSSQDSTSVIPLLQALVTAMTQAQARVQAQEPSQSTLERLQEMAERMATLQALVERLQNRE